MPSALRRAIAALVDNALAHARTAGTISVELRAESRPAPPSVVLVRVSDDGSGLDPAHAAELTTRFTRGTTATEGTQRLGLGLALVSEVVHAHDGSLEISGELGAGASILLAFPSLSAPS